MVKLRERFRFWDKLAKYTEESGVRMTKPITSLSEDDVKWVHRTVMTDVEKGRRIYNLSADERLTWRIMCTIAALNALSRK